MKKIITCAAVCAAILSAAALSGCGHEHTPGTSWSVGRESHWQECTECKAKYDEGKHSFDEFDVCTECNSSVYINDDGSFGFSTFDENGSMIYDAGYDTDENLTYYFRYEIDYYEDGNVKCSKEYTYDVLSETGKEYLSYESYFLPCEKDEFAEVFLAHEAFINEDGSSQTYEYDELLGITGCTELDAAGTVILVERYEYEFNEDGTVAKQTLYSNDIKSREIYYAYDDDGCQYDARWLYFDENGSITEEYSYDMYGNETE